ncbi:MAG: DUF1684 domain-containing protein [Candidatus Marinimicrobia bacterium]|nr:DUF1684 domain-containing protein [Candidatus Neomarinimicrobiota bacterium]
MNMKNYKTEIIKNRIGKDEFFKEHDQSPIPQKERANFTKLNYFEPNIDYRFKLELEEFGQKEKVKIEDTGGNLRDFLKWGKFTFTINDQKCVLFAYKSEAPETRLFIPFKDATSGKETYGAGRYLDLYEERDKIGNKWILDFNLATNPWCAYSPNYVCPLIPFENILKVEIKAGEKSYK